MTDRIVAEGATLNETLANALAQLGGQSLDEVAYEFDKEHFRRGAQTVRLEAWLKGETDLEALRLARKSVDDAKGWVEQALAAFGSQGTVSARKGGDGRVYVQVIANEDARLLIGRQGRNIRAFQALLEAALKKQGNDVEIKLDVESEDDGRDRDDRGGRDRSRGRDRDDRGGRDRGRGRDRGGRDRGRGRDRGDRGGGRRVDAEREADIVKQTRQAANVILDGDDDAIVLGEMNSYERHVAHATVKDISGVDSRSVGNGDDRKVEVFSAE